MGGRVRDPEKMRDYARKWRARHPLRWKESYLKRTYGLTVEEFETKKTRQGNLCCLCGLPMTEGMHYEQPVLDHDHDTGVNRDFIHRKCNIALGLFEDDPEICRRAAAYLERHVL